MIYEKSNLKVISAFEIRQLKHPDQDVDLIIPIGNRVVNLNLPKLPSYLLGRLQFTNVSSFIIRHNTSPNNNEATIHLMRSIDMSTALVNFTVNYKSLEFHIKDSAYWIDFNLTNTSNLTK